MKKIAIPMPDYLPGSEPEETPVTETPATTAPFEENVSGPAVNALPDVAKMQSAIEELANKIKSGKISANIPQDLIESLTAVSEPIQGQQFSDGMWGPVTDKTLHNIVAFANVLISLPEKLGLPNTIYNKENLDHLIEGLSGYQVEGHHITLDQEEQIKRAPYITEHIEAISKLYSYLLEKIPAGNEHHLNTNEQNAISSGSTSVQYKGQTINVPLSALTSITKYNEFIKPMNMNDKDKMALLDLIIGEGRMTYHKDWDLMQDSWLISKLIKSAQDQSSNTDNAIIGSKLATILKQQLMAAQTQSAPAPGQSPAPTKQQEVDVMEVASQQPFNSGYISLDQIKRFVTDYAALSNNPAAKTALNQITTDIQTAQKLMSRPTSTISLDNMNDTTLSLLTNQPIPLVYVLYSIVDNASNMYRQFSVEQRNSILAETNGSSAYRSVVQQIQPEGPAAANLRTLTRIINELRSQIGKRR